LGGKDTITSGRKRKKRLPNPGEQKVLRKINFSPNCSLSNLLSV